VQGNLRARDWNILKLQGGTALQQGGEFCIPNPCLRKGIGGDRRADCLNARKGVGDHVVLAGDVADVSSELGNEVQVIELPRAAFVAILGEGVGQRLVVCEN
jgi:hypothetical protein